MRYLLLIMLIFSFSFSSIKRDNSRNVVIDLDSKLMWIDDVSNIKLRLTHEEATAYCETLSFGGYTNWRIPEIEEYETIVDKRNERTYINRSFRFNLPEGYWARKAHWRTLWFYADYMFFVSGTPYYDSRHKTKLFRCVRDIK